MNKQYRYLVRRFSLDAFDNENYSSDFLSNEYGKHGYKLVNIQRENIINNKGEVDGCFICIFVREADDGDFE